MGSRDSETPPPVIPDYELLKIIGSGSYGDVWLARSITGAFRAVKIVWRARFTEELPYEREFLGLQHFEQISLRESRQLALLHVGRRDDEGFFYYAMELADDQETAHLIDPEHYSPLTLRDLSRRGDLSMIEVLELATELARGLSILHRAGLVHRDIKPSNVIIVRGQPKLADIGLVSTSELARTFVGTEGFVAPEGPGTASSDVFAFGKVLYELFTGKDRLAFPALPNNFSQRGDASLLLEINAVVLRACDPDRRVRHTDGAALLEDFLLIQAGKSVKRLRATEQAFSRALKLIGALCVTSLVAGVGAAFAWHVAQQEMARRAMVEAERDTLTRTIQYSSFLTQAEREISEGRAGRARQLLDSARESLGDKAVGPEWHWLHAKSWHGVERRIRAGGTPVRKLAADAEGRWLAINDNVGGLEVFDRTQDRFLELEADALFIADWSALRPELWGVTADGTLWRFDGVSETVTEKTLGFPVVSTPQVPLQPLTVGETEALFFAETRTPGRLWRYEAQTASSEVAADWLSATEDQAWELFRYAVDDANAWVAISWVSGVGSSLAWWVTVASLDPEVVRSFSVDFRPSFLTWQHVCGESPVLELMDDISGQRKDYMPREDRWPSVPDSFPDTSFVKRKRVAEEVVEIQGATWALLGEEDEITWQAQAHTGTVTDVLHLPDGHYVSASASGEVFEWDRERTSFFDQQTLTISQAHVTDLRASFLEEDRSLLLADDGAVVRWDLATAREVARIEGLRWLLPEKGQAHLGVDASGQHLIQWFSASGEQRAIGEGTLQEIQYVAQSGDGTRWVYTVADGSIWVQESGNPAIRLDLPALRRWAVQLDETGRFVWFVTEENAIVCWDLAQMQEQWRMAIPARVGHLAVTETAVAAALLSGDVHLYARSTGQLMRRIPSGSSSAEYLHINSSTQRAYVAGNDGAIHVFDTEGWIKLVTLRIPDACPLWFTLTDHDDGVLVAIARDGTVFSWQRTD